MGRAGRWSVRPLFPEWPSEYWTEEPGRKLLKSLPGSRFSAPSRGLAVGEEARVALQPLGGAREPGPARPPRPGKLRVTL